MEAFALLKYCRTAGGSAVLTTNAPSAANNATPKFSIQKDLDDDEASETESSDSRAPNFDKMKNHDRRMDDKVVTALNFDDEKVKGPLASLLARERINNGGQGNVQNSPRQCSVKETLNGYLNRVSSRYIVRMMRTGAAAGNQLQATVGAVRRCLSKRRSTSAASPPRKMGSDRRYEPLLEVQDGIQEAILHCRRSFYSSRGMIPPN